MCKKISAGLFSCMLFVLKPYFYDLFRIFGNFDVDWRTKKTKIKGPVVIFFLIAMKSIRAKFFSQLSKPCRKTISRWRNYYFLQKVSKLAQGIVIVIWQALLIAAPHGLHNKQVLRTSSFWWCDHVKKDDGCIHSTKYMAKYTVFGTAPWVATDLSALSRSLIEWVVSGENAHPVEKKPSINEETHLFG